jgi:hypothetical protein
MPGQGRRRRADEVFVGTRAVTIAGSAFAVVASVAIAFSAAGSGDYPTQAGPAVSALAHGDLSAFFDTQPVYGAFSVIVRAPFALPGFLLGDGSDLLVYRLGALPCLLAVGLLGAYVARLMSRRGQSAAACLAVCALALLNPATQAAIDNGHPEELLAGALAVSALLAAVRDRPLWAGALLGLAICTKQWAILAVPPVLLVTAAGRHWARVAGIAALIVFALTAPLAFANPTTFTTNAKSAEGVTSHVSRFNVWWPVSSTRTEKITLGREVRTVSRQRLPRALSAGARPLAVVLAVALTVLYARRRSRRPLEDALALLALVFAARCVLDPLNNAYYHVPLLLSLLAWEGLRITGLPAISVLVVAGLWATFHQPLLGAAAADNAFYLAWTLALAGWIAVRLFAPATFHGTDASPAGERPLLSLTRSSTRPQT